MDGFGSINEYILYFIWNLSLENVSVFSNERPVSESYKMHLSIWGMLIIYLSLKKIKVSKIILIKMERNCMDLVI